MRTRELDAKTLIAFLLLLEGTKSTFATLTVSALSIRAKGEGRVLRFLRSGAGGFGRPPSDAHPSTERSDWKAGVAEDFESRLVIHLPKPLVTEDFIGLSGGEDIPPRAQAVGDKCWAQLLL